MQHTTASATRRPVPPAPIWVLVLGVLLLLLAVAPSLVTPAATSPRRAQTMSCSSANHSSDDVDVPMMVPCPNDR